MRGVFNNKQSFRKETGKGIVPIWGAVRNEESLSKGGRESHGSDNPCRLVGRVSWARAWVGKFPPSRNPHLRVRVRGQVRVFFFSVTESHSSPPLTLIIWCHLRSLLTSWQLVSHCHGIANTTSVLYGSSRVIPSPHACLESQVHLWLLKSLSHQSTVGYAACLRLDCLESCDSCPVVSRGIPLDSSLY
jgi:hypothetical protein